MSLHAIPVMSNRIDNQGCNCTCTWRKGKNDYCTTGLHVQQHWTSCKSMRKHCAGSAFTKMSGDENIVSHRCAAFTTSLKPNNAAYAACASPGFTELKR